jgi:hypothetical protein
MRELSAALGNDSAFDLLGPVLGAKFSLTAAFVRFYSSVWLCFTL